jgi:hypothetical protein
VSADDLPPPFNEILGAIARRARGIDLAAFADLPPEERERIASDVVHAAMREALPPWRVRLYELARVAGGFPALAEMALTSTKTLRGWADGKIFPTENAQTLLNTIAENHGVPLPFPEVKR